MIAIGQDVPLSAPSAQTQTYVCDFCQRQFFEHQAGPYDNETLGIVCCNRVGCGDKAAREIADRACEHAEALVQHEEAQSIALRNRRDLASLIYEAEQQHKGKPAKLSNAAPEDHGRCMYIALCLESHIATTVRRVDTNVTNALELLEEMLSRFKPAS